MPVPLTDQMQMSITRPAGGSVDYVQIRGDVDLSDSAELGVAAQRLHDGAAGSICVDLGGTTFMDSTLVEFLRDLGDGQDGDRRQLVICRPSRMAQRLIHLTGLDMLANVRPDLPPLWPDVPAARPDRSV
jgi:anti-anti-sigma factor